MLRRCTMEAPLPRTFGALFASAERVLLGIPPPSSSSVLVALRFALCGLRHACEVTHATQGDDRRLKRASSSSMWSWDREGVGSHGLKAHPVNWLDQQIALHLSSIGGACEQLRDADPGVATRELVRSRGRRGGVGPGLHVLAFASRSLRCFGSCFRPGLEETLACVS